MFRTWCGCDRCRWRQYIWHAGCVFWLNGWTDPCPSRAPLRRWVRWEWCRWHRWWHTIIQCEQFFNGHIAFLRSISRRRRKNGLVSKPQLAETVNVRFTRCKFDSSAFGSSASLAANASSSSSVRSSSKSLTIISTDGSNNLSAFGSALTLLWRLEPLARWLRDEDELSLNCFLADDIFPALLYQTKRSQTKTGTTLKQFSFLKKWHKWWVLLTASQKDKMKYLLHFMQCPLWNLQCFCFRIFRNAKWEIPQLKYENTPSPKVNINNRTPAFHVTDTLIKQKKWIARSKGIPDGHRITIRRKRKRWK